jgi:tetratricopeptide (TPR) repeat protein
MQLKTYISLSLILCLIFITSNGYTATRLIIPPAPEISVDRTVSDYQTELWQQLQNAFIESGRVELIDAKKISAHLNSQKDEQSAAVKFTPEDEKEADDLLAKGWEDFKNLKLDTAIDKLEKAKIKFRDLLPWTLSSKKLLTAYLHLGIAYLSNGEKTRGQQEIREMLTLDPSRTTRKLNPKYYTPEVIQFFETQRKEIVDKANAKLNIELTPPTAKVWCDGLEIQGLTINHLPEGEHFVASRADGYKDFFVKKFIVSGENNISIRMEGVVKENLSSYFTPIRSAYDLPQETVAFLDDLTVKLSGDVILFYRLSLGSNNLPASVEGQLYDQRSQETSSIESVPISSLNESPAVAKKLVKGLSDQIDARGYVVSRLMLEQQKNDAGKSESNINPDLLSQDPNSTNNHQPTLRPWYKKWWIWGVVAGGAGLTIGGVLLFSGSSSSSTSTLVIDNPTN